MRVRDLDYAFCSKTRHSPQSAHLNLDPSTFQFVRSPARTCVALRASSRSFRVSAPATQQDNQQAQDHKNQNRDHGNGAPNCKNLTSPSVAVFLEDYIKSALNTLIQAAYSRWRRAAKWHGQPFRNWSLAICLFRKRRRRSKTGQCSMALPGSWVLVRI